MPPRPLERYPQHEFALRLRAAIDQAILRPSEERAREAIELALSQPVALRSSHVRHNLGRTRWRWLESHGVYPIGEGGEIPGSVKMTITPTKVTS